MAIYTKASELYPNCYRTWNNIGMMAFRADLAKAEQMFNKSNSVKANPEANMNLGLVALTKVTRLRLNSCSVAQRALLN